MVGPLDCSSAESVIYFVLPGLYFRDDVIAKSVTLL